MESQNQSMEEEVKCTKSEVGAEPQVVVQNKNAKVLAKHLKAHDVIQ